MSSTFGLYSRYYDLLYQDKDYEGETAYICSLINRFAPATRDVLEFGCGTGKHARLLAQSGLNVTGVERSETMIAAAETQNDQVKIVHGDARSIQLGTRFDTLLSLFHVVSYQTTNDDVAKLFETASIHLRNDGHFIFDVWYGPAVLRQLPEPRVKQMEDERTEVRRVAQPVVDFNRNLVEVNYEITVIDKSSGRIEQLNECHRMRYFFGPEIDLFASSAQMKVVHREKWMDGAIPSPDSWGVTFVLQNDRV